MAMPVSDIQTTTLSFHGRLADSLTRDVIPMKAFEVQSNWIFSETQYKIDGHFSFYDFPVSPTAYSFYIQGKGYRSRSVEKLLPGSTPVELEYPGEDEVYLFVNFIDGATNRIDFDSIDFLQVIPSGAQVLGPGGFSAILSESIGGSGVSMATLDSVAGLSIGDLLRIRRSNNILLYPSWVYQFRESMTMLYISVKADTPQQEPVENARITIRRINGNVVSAQNIAGLTLYRVSLGSPNPYILGTVHDREQYTDVKGKSLIFFPGGLPVANIRIRIVHNQYITQNLTIPVTVGNNTYHTALLTPV